MTPLMEGPDPEAQGRGGAKKETSWELIRTWVRMQKGGASAGSFLVPPFMHAGSSSKRMDLRLILGVLGCPLAPVPWPSDHAATRDHSSIKDSPIETSSARYIVHQYLAAAGCLKQRQCRKSMYVAGSVKMVFCETESGGLGKTVRNAAGGKGKCRESGCFVLWQMSPGVWSVELVVAGYKVAAGCDGKVVWRHLPWLGLSAAKGPQRPLRRIIQGLDPKSTASMFTKAQCLGEKRIGDEDCFVLKVSADRTLVAERSDGQAEVIRHVLYGYFSQKSGLLIYMEDSHLTRVQAPGSDAVYWETTIGSSVEDYREVDGVLIAHQGRSVATVFRFGEVSAHHSRTRMEEAWRIDDVVFNVPGLSMDCFIPPTEILSIASAK